MSKLDELRRSAGANVKDSTGADRDTVAGVSTGGPPARWRGVIRSKDVAAIPVGMIAPDPEQPREEFDEDSLRRLADSLRIRGQLQPVRVRWDEGRGAYVILVGERRWRAAQLAGLSELQAVIVDRELPADEILMIQLVENALREDLKPVEQAKSYQRLINTRGWSTRELAAELHVAQSSVVRSLALLDLPPVVQQQVEQGELAATVAYEVARLPDAESQVAVAAAVLEQGLTRQEVSDLVQAVRAKRPAPTAKPDPVEINIGDGVVVLVKYRKPSSVTIVAALKRALKMVQAQTQADEQAA